MNDVGMANLDREIAAAKAHTLVRDERYFWEHRADYPGLRPILFPGPEKWKVAAIRGLVLCPGCEVKGEHYHEKGGDGS